MGRFILLVVIVLFQSRQLDANYQAMLSLNMDFNKVLSGHSFRNISGITMENCLGHCLKECLCLSFQLCDGTAECQLCSSNKYLSQQMQQSNGCTNYDFGSQERTKVSNQQCSHNPTTVFDCCITSNPCLNGGTCLPPLSGSRKRFRCKCPDGYEGERCEMCKPGYTGQQCEHRIRSCRGYGNGSRIPGNYTVFDHNNKSFEVYCDFDKNSFMTWTLIQSYSLKNNVNFHRTSLFADSPENENDPSWLQYRLSKSRMESIQGDSAKWRVTCRYETGGVNYTDYLRALNTKLNILTNFAVQCVEVEYINVRGQNCTNCTVYMRQEYYYTLHFLSGESNTGCYFMYMISAGQLQQCGIYGYYFGHYYCPDTQHRCTSSDDATTQTWMGASD